MLDLNSIQSTVATMYSGPPIGESGNRGNGKKEKLWILGSVGVFWGSYVMIIMFVSTGDIIIDRQ